MKGTSTPRRFALLGFRNFLLRKSAKGDAPPGYGRCVGEYLEAMSEIDVVTFGCRLNAYESQVMRAHARAAHDRPGASAR